MLRNTLQHLKTLIWKAKEVWPQLLEFYSARVHSIAAPMRLITRLRSILLHVGASADVLVPWLGCSSASVLECECRVIDRTNRMLALHQTSSFF